jgi:hypothetical protein
VKSLLRVEPVGIGAGREGSVGGGREYSGGVAEAHHGGPLGWSGCNTPSPLRLGLSLFFFYNKIFAKIHKVYQST